MTGFFNEPILLISMDKCAGFGAIKLGGIAVCSADQGSTSSNRIEFRMLSLTFCTIRFSVSRDRKAKLVAATISMGVPKVDIA